MGREGAGSGGYTTGDGSDTGGSSAAAIVERTISTRRFLRRASGVRSLAPGLDAPRLCVRYCGSCAAMSSSSGNKARSTRGRRLPRSRTVTRDCTWKSSPPMPQHATPQNRSGAILKVIPPTVAHGIRGTSAAASTPIPVGSGASRRSCVHSFWLLRSCLHRDTLSIAYAKFINTRPWVFGCSAQSVCPIPEKAVCTSRVH